MLNFIHKKANPLQDQIEYLLDSMTTYATDSSEYTTLLDKVERLYKISNHENGKKPSVDTILLVAGNLAGILLILNYERAAIVTTKALGFVMKTKL